MKFSVSNIAWNPESDAAVRSVLEQAGIKGVEVAPTRLWPNWEGASIRSALEHRASFESTGFLIPALQAILFGQADLKLFGSDADRSRLKSHLTEVAALGQALGATSLVFGAPKNRLIGDLSPAAAFEIAREFLSDIAVSFAERSVCLCLEANPPDYGCTFLTKAEDAARLVAKIGSPGIGLHLDTACMSLAGEDICATVERHISLVRHFHVSEPFLEHFASPKIDHTSVAACLATAGYRGWISLEMRETTQPIADIAAAANFLIRTYGPANGNDHSGL